MGICSSGRSAVYEKDEFSAGDRRSIVRMQQRLKKELSIPLEIYVAHFTPSSFPVIPVMNKKLSALCNSSWQKVMTSDYTSDSGEVTSGLVMFYNDFYERLETVDTSGKIESVLSRSASSENKVAAKGGVLIRIINYVLLIEEDSKSTQTMLYMLGVSHSQKHIRPWSYSVLVQTLLLTLAARLGTDASNAVMEAWVNVFAFIMKSMLPPAIEGQVVPTEVHINTSSDFAGGKIAEQVEVLEEVKNIRRKFSRDSASHRGDDDTMSMMSSRMGNRGLHNGSEYTANTAREGLRLSARDLMTSSPSLSYMTDNFGGSNDPSHIGGVSERTKYKAAIDVKWFKTNHRTRPFNVRHHLLSLHSLPIYRSGWNSASKVPSPAPALYTTTFISSVSVSPFLCSANGASTCSQSSSSPHLFAHESRFFFSISLFAFASLLATAFWFAFVSALPPQLSSRSRFPTSMNVASLNHYMLRCCKQEREKKLAGIMTYPYVLVYCV
eukprot:gene10066-20978_t